MKTYEGVEVYLHAFLTSQLDGDKWSASLPGRFILMERAPARYPFVGGWLGPRITVWARWGREKISFLPLPEIVPVA